MIHELKIPHMGSVENARLVAWHVSEGQVFVEGEVLYEIETDKTTTEVEALSAGLLARQLAAPGDDFKVGDLVGLWADPGTNQADLEIARGKDERQPQPATVESRQPAVSQAQAAPVSAGARPISLAATGGKRVSPLARRLAAQHRVDVSVLAGSGAGGKITGADVRKAAEASSRPPIVEQEARPSAQTSLQPATAPQASATDAKFHPHSLRRKTIAGRMTEAAAVPSLTADIEIDLMRAMEARKRPDAAGVSVLGLIAHQTVLALLENPALNAHWEEDGVTMWSTVHLGIAVDTIDGLVVPVIRHAERLSAIGLTQEIARLAKAATEGRLTFADLEGGTFTISNPGSIGPVVRAEALLNVPQVALLGLPGIVRAPVPIPDGAGGWALAVRQLIRPGLTFDHRALDGGPVVRFLNTLKSKIEAL